MAIRFHSEEIQFRLQKKTGHRNWLSCCIRFHKREAGEINMVFISNARMRRMNRKYLKHDYDTDVITFDYSDGSEISGDVFINVEQVRKNAAHYQVTEDEEIRRVMIHGILHLAGYRDSNRKEQKVMREMENEALNLWKKEEQNNGRI